MGESLPRYVHLQEMPQVQEVDMQVLISGKRGAHIDHGVLPRKLDLVLPNQERGITNELYIGRQDKMQSSQEKI